MIAGGKNYMDKSVEITPENILSSVEEVYHGYKTDKGTREAILGLFRRLATGAWVPVASLLGGARMAYAADESGLATAAADVAAKYSPAGNVSYTTFLKGVQEHMIERVRIDPTGRTAEFLNVDGARGMVNLFNDPNLLKILQENKIDISVTPQDPGNPILGVLSSLAFPLFIIAGLFILSRRAGGGMPGSNDPNNPFNIGKSKAKVQMEPNTGVDFA
jgi:cell division protease FtsH